LADAERRRLATDGRNWKRWGPYVSERAWGAVREDYGAEGNPWGYFPHDHARSRAYRWSEDGLAGICDEPQVLCFALALWNGRDPILKERLFGLTGEEGNHGEDVKEYWWYLDSTPTHSFMRWRYVYPQGAFPYDRLVGESRRRSRVDPEFELIGGMTARVDYEPAESRTGMFAGNSNWRGPVWFPVNYLAIEALEVFHRYLGDEFRVEMPTGSGRTATLEEIANELAWRLVGLFLNDAAGRRPVFGQTDKFQTDPAWHDMIPFHEYFHGDTGAGLGASHQTGWTGLVVDLILRHCGASKGA